MSDQSDASAARATLPTQVGSTSCGMWTLDAGRHLGSGHFGDVYEGTAVAGSAAPADAQRVAIKISQSRISSKEIRALLLLNGKGAPKLFYHSIAPHGIWHVLVMEKCGKSLYSVIEQRSSSKNCCWMLNPSEARIVALQALNLIERLHSLGFVHADIKPANLVCAPGQDSFLAGIRLVDFGLSRPWMDAYKQHVEYWQHLTHFAGSLRYASLHAHLGRGLTRRDDLESLGYMILYLMQGSLPWQGFRGGEKGKLICLTKGAVSLPELCKDMPEGLLFYLSNVRSIGYDALPDYDYLRSCLDFDRVDMRLNEPISPNQSSLEATLAESVGNGKAKSKKRGERSEDLDVVVPAKRQKCIVPQPISRKIHQWIIISTQNTDDGSSSLGQAMVSSPDFSRLQRAVVAHAKKSAKLARRGTDPPAWRVRSMCYAEKQYVAVLTQDSQAENIAEEKFHRVTSDADFLDMVESLAVQRFSISQILGSPRGWVLCSTNFANDHFENQMFAISETFPSHWVAENWDKGYFITSIGAQATKWAVVMSRGPGVEFEEQAVELSFCYPSESIRARWRDGYALTSTACTAEQSAWVLSRHASTSNIDVVQRCTRTSHDPQLKLPIENKQSFTIDCLTFGRVE